MQYQVSVTMTAATVTALVNSGSNLYVFRAVQASDQAGRPLLWRTSGYSALTEITWDDGWNAFTSESGIDAGQEITVGFFTAIDVGQLVQVSAGGLGEVTDEGYAGVIALLNTTTTEYTCGLGCADDDDDSEPFCAFPLYGGNLQTITPLQSVLLMFSTEVIDPGTVIGSYGSASLASYSAGLLIDLTSANQRSVGYDINTGWSCGGCSWAQSVTAGTDLVPLLIQPPESSPLTKLNRDPAGRRSRRSDRPRS